eukprot:TRINITY_DN962_c0_g1_i1.p1 TRINITY_DN962_c0_g1~~TRINITY_DN962_c0_g1_i1.p1  ORF type:complete len:837 (+),score=307.79 TRINITY_DN962_c0_g1_i1:816-3326(+)
MDDDEEDEEDEDLNDDGIMIPLSQHEEVVAEMEHQFQLLRAALRQQVEKMKIEHASEIQKIKDLHDAELGKLTSKHDAEVLVISESHGADKETLNAEFRSRIEAELSKKYQLERKVAEQEWSKRHDQAMQAQERDFRVKISQVRSELTEKLHRRETEVRAECESAMKEEKEKFYRVTESSFRQKQREWKKKEKQRLAAEAESKQRRMELEMEEKVAQQVDAEGKRIEAAVRKQINAQNDKVIEERVMMEVKRLEGEFELEVAKVRDESIEKLRILEEQQCKLLDEEYSRRLEEQKEAIREEIRGEMRSEAERKLREALLVKLRPRVQEDLRLELETKMRKEIREELERQYGQRGQSFEHGSIPAVAESLPQGHESLDVKKHAFTPGKKESPSLHKHEDGHGSHLSDSSETPKLSEKKKSIDEKPHSGSHGLPATRLQNPFLRAIATPQSSLRGSSRTSAKKPPRSRIRQHVLDVSSLSTFDADAMAREMMAEARGSTAIEELSGVDEQKEEQRSDHPSQHSFETLERESSVIEKDSSPPSPRTPKNCKSKSSSSPTMGKSSLVSFKSPSKTTATDDKEPLSSEKLSSLDIRIHEFEEAFEEIEDMEKEARSEWETYNPYTLSQGWPIEAQEAYEELQVLWMRRRVSYQDRVSFVRGLKEDMRKPGWSDDDLVSAVQSTLSRIRNEELKTGTLLDKALAREGMRARVEDYEEPDEELSVANVAGSKRLRKKWMERNKFLKEHDNLTTRLRSKLTAIESEHGVILKVHGVRYLDVLDRDALVRERKEELQFLKSVRKKQASYRTTKGKSTTGRAKRTFPPHSSSSAKSSARRPLSGWQ